MLSSIISLTKKLISIKSTPDNPNALKKVLDVALSHLKSYVIEYFEHDGIKSVLVYNTKKRPEKFRILLNGHLDIIPGKEHQYLPQIKGNRLYGVGSMDMKANVSCLITVFKEMVDKVAYPLGLQLVTDEEVGGFDGTKYQIEKGVRADFVVAGEPTNFDIVNKAKGILWIKILVHGKAAHSAYPWKGENAIWKMNDFLYVLKKKYPVPVKEKSTTTVNLSKIETGNYAFNKIPDDCVIGLDIRYAPEETNTILINIKKLLPKGFIIDVITKEPALFTDGDNEYIKILQKVGKEVIKKKFSLREAQGSSDVRHFALVDCPGIEFGPIGGGIGSDNEWVDISSLETYCQILKKFLLSVNG